MQRLVKREFAGADYVLLAEVGSGPSAVLGLSPTGAALCATDGRGKQASVVKWSHGSPVALEMHLDLYKDSLPVLSTNSISLASLRTAVRLRLPAETVPPRSSFLGNPGAAGVGMNSLANRPLVWLAPNPSLHPEVLQRAPPASVPG